VEACCRPAGVFGRLFCAHLNAILQKSLCLARVLWNRQSGPGEDFTGPNVLAEECAVRLRRVLCLVPTFRSSCSVAAPTFTIFGKSWALANLLILVPLYRSEVPDRIRRLWCRDFRSAVLMALGLSLAACSRETDYTPEQRSCIAQHYANYDARQLNQCVDVVQALHEGQCAHL
jgi:hypothetical protein